MAMCQKKPNVDESQVAYWIVGYDDSSRCGYPSQSDHWLAGQHPVDSQQRFPASVSLWHILLVALWPCASSKSYHYSPCCFAPSLGLGDWVA